MKHNFPKIHFCQTQSIYLNGTGPYRIWVPNNVLPPSQTSLFMAKTVLGIKGHRALDIGVGCGILTIALIKSGCEEVWATDINAHALECTKYNLRLNGIKKVVEYQLVDISNWKPEIEFDLIVGNPPFMPLPNGIEIINQGINLAVNGGKDGTDKIILFAEAAARLLKQNGRFIFAIPHFSDYQKVIRSFSDVFSFKVIAKSTMEYWPVNWDKRCSSHIKELEKVGKVNLMKDNNSLSSSLEIIEGTLI